MAEIEFPGLLSLNGLDGTGIDVDNDGKEKLYIHSGNTIIVLKFTGTPNNPDYQLYYFRNFDYLVDAATIYQFPKEKYPSIVLSMNQSENMNSRIFSWVYKHYLITDVKEEKPD